MRQHAQPLSSDTHSFELAPRSYVTSGIDTASDVRTAYLPGNFFSEVLLPTHVASTVRLPEYFTADNASNPTPNFADQLRVDRFTIYERHFRASI